MMVLVHTSSAEYFAEELTIGKVFEIFIKQYRLEYEKAIHVVLYLFVGFTSPPLAVERVNRKNGTFYQFTWSNNG